MELIEIDWQPCTKLSPTLIVFMDYKEMEKLKHPLEWEKVWHEVEYGQGGRVLGHHWARTYCGQVVVEGSPYHIRVTKHLTRHAEKDGIMTFCERCEEAKQWSK